MSCIMKYRAKGSGKEWQYYEDRDSQHCIDHLIMKEYEKDYEYEIYEFSEDGVIYGVNCEDEFNFFETKLEYLFYIYHCDNIATLKVRCPINLNLLDLQGEATEEFKKAINEL